MKRNQYTIAVDRLTFGKAPWAKFILPYAGETSLTKPYEINLLKPDEVSLEPREISPDTGDEISHGAVYKERARACARPNPSIHPSFLAYAWPSEEMRAKAQRALATCGPGLADVGTYAIRMLASLEVLLSEHWGDEDFFRLYVLPMIQAKTKKVRDEEKRLMDFYPIDRSISESLQTRTLNGRSNVEASGRRHTGMAKKTEAVAASFPTSESRLATARRNLERVQRGEIHHSDVPAQFRTLFHGSDEEKQEACRHAVLAAEAELAALEHKCAPAKIAGAKDT